MITKIKRLFQRSRWPKDKNDNPRRFDCRKNFWGHACRVDKNSYLEISNGPGAGSYWECSGHLYPAVRVGDEVIIILTKGAAVFRFVEVRNCSDPADMFFATIGALGYLDDVPERVITNELSDTATIGLRGF